MPREHIKVAPNVFQPRLDSIAFAPGRSEGHIADLARIVRQGRALDPVTVAAFGRDWYLVDGHHRMAAYEAAGWDKPIPVHPVQSALTGAPRVDWATELSFADNAKSRLSMSPADKADGAWAAVARGADPSIARTAAAYGVSDRTVATMRGVRRELEELGVPAGTFPRWRTAKNELVRMKDGATDRGVDPQERQRREAAKRLKGVMDLRLAPDLLAEALESYSPGIVAAMAEAQGLEEEDA